MGSLVGGILHSWYWSKQPAGTHLFGEDCDILVEGLGGADIPSRDSRLPGSACRQLAFLKD